MSSTTDELVSSLSCTEFLSDSPSTSRYLPVNHDSRPRGSSRVMQQREPRRRSTRMVLQAVNRTHFGTSYCRARVSADSRLNRAQHASVQTLPDRALTADSRVLDSLMRNQLAMAVNCHYFTSIQNQVTPKIREQAIEWIRDVSMEEKCDVDIFPLAVNIMDRFLSVQDIYRSDIQVLAGVCLFIASKMKAPNPLTVHRMVYYTADSVSASAFLGWELLVLSSLEWDINGPTAFDFYDQLSAKLPGLNWVREEFTRAVHSMQKDTKLGMFQPSFQCALALLYATEKSRNRMLLAELELIMPYAVNMDNTIIYSYMPSLLRLIESEALQSRAEEMMRSAPAAPPSSCKTPSPSFSPPGFTLATPLNDSGFCSGVSSPESVCKKDMDCSPPKMARLSV